MQAVSRMDPAQSLSTHASESGETWNGRIVSVGRWMTALGILRLAYASAAWITAVAASSARQNLDSMIGLVPPVNALFMIWPVVLGILVSRTRWPELLRAASLTFLLLAISGVLKAFADWSLAGRVPIAIGSFEVTRADLALSNPKGMILALFGAVQLLAELFVAGRSTWLLRSRESSRLGTEAANRELETASRTRSILSRACWVGCFAFLAMVLHIPSVPKISGLVEASPFLRDLLLMNDQPNGPRRIRPAQSSTRTPAQEHEIQNLMHEATTSWGEKHYEEASLAFQKLITIYQSRDITRDQQSRNNLAMLENNLAWLLVTRPDPGTGDPEKAVENARNALTFNPSDGSYWNTLGAAEYRAKDWQSAKDALLRSMELRGDGDGYDWILFALVHAQTGRKDRALEWFDKAARWRKDFRPWDHDLYHFETEAAHLLELPDPPIPVKPTPFRNHDDFNQMTSKGRSFPINPQMGEPKKARRTLRKPGT